MPSPPSSSSSASSSAGHIPAAHPSAEAARARAISGSLATRKLKLEAAYTRHEQNSPASPASRKKHAFLIPLRRPRLARATSDNPSQPAQQHTPTPAENMPSLNPASSPQSIPSASAESSHLPKPTQEKRSRAIRLTSSIRKAGNSLSPRTASAASTAATPTASPNSNQSQSQSQSQSQNQQQRSQRTSRLFSSRSTISSSSSTTTQTTTTTTTTASHHAPLCSVPMTPISPDCNPSQAADNPILANQTTATIHPQNNPPTTPELTPTPASSNSLKTTNEHYSLIPPSTPKSTSDQHPSSQLKNTDEQPSSQPKSTNDPLKNTNEQKNTNNQHHPSISPSTSPDLPDPPRSLSQHPLPLSKQHSPHSNPLQITPSSSPTQDPSTPSLIQDNQPTPSPSSDLHHQSSTPTASKHHPSQNILTIALSKAQTAVQLDTALQIPDAIRAYTEAVLLLEQVIDNIDVSSKEREEKEWDGLMRDQARDKIWAEEIWKQLGQDDLDDLDREDLESRLRERERKWLEKQWKIQKRKKARADEEDRLIGIHNTYASRIAELQAEILSNHRAILHSDQSPDSSPTRGWSQSDDQQPPLSNSTSQHNPLSETERKSFSSDSTTREGILQPQHLELPSTPQPTSHEPVSLASSYNDPESFRQSCEIAEEEKDVVSERLPHYGSVHSQNTRNRASSSISGASLSQLGRTQSSESMTTRRTSVSSNAYHLDQSRPTIPQAATEAQQFDSSDGRNRSSGDPRPASRHSARLSDATIASARPESPRTTALSANQNVRRQPSQKLLVSQTTTQGTISQRRRSPSCVDTSRRSLSRSQGHPEPGTISFTQPANSDLSSSMNRRPSNLSLMGTVPSAAIPLRLRSYSQPGKRPGLPLSFIADNTPPVPHSPLLSGPSQVPTPRKPSSLIHNTPPLGSSTSQDVPHQSARPTSQLAAPGPRPLSHTFCIHPNGGMTRSESQHALPMYDIQPYAHASLSPGSMYSGSAAPVGALPAYPKIPARRPFHLMRQIRTSMSTGAYVSPRLYVPRQMWYQAQVKLHGLETKIKLMDTLIAGLELVERDGAGLVGVEVPSSATKEPVWDFAEGRKPKPTLSSQVLTATERFMKRLEIFEELLDNLQTGGAKKLGLNASGLHETAYGQDTMRKGGGFGTLMAQKLGKGLDRINLGRGNADLPTLYVDTIARLFDKSQAIDAHLASLDLAARSQGSTAGAGMYSAIGQQSKQHIEGRLRRVSEFYSTVVCRFVVADMGVLLDKYVKRGGNWCGD
ncbi:hypothetical protein PtA15_3A4 [Puccinia triticina]|uniref:MIT domain-containing protein n=1 Tax=Puccinia triticina TaxID=208348 RepID=A0ABY7CBQ4_9BASI|nr:uncharacterized protein PtA15_3A4 [Puccinia triticina]WAQ82641.1 hypothetical protein PtA15_3A4 [Puccinia triticina]